MGEIISGERRIDSGALVERAARAASGLASLGVGPGDTVAVYLRNDLPFFEASYAAGRLGAYPTPVNWHYTEDEARYLFENSGARAIVIHADLIESVRTALPPGVPVLVVETPPEVPEAYGVEPAHRRVPDGMVDWSRWLRRLRTYAGDDTAAPGTIIYTSGTTGRPQGCAPPSAEPRAGGARRPDPRRAGSVSWVSTRRKIVTVVTGPMYHSAQPNAYGLSSGRLGGTVILQARFDPEELLQLIDRHRVTHLHMVPIMFNRLLKLPEAVKAKYDVSSLPLCLVHDGRALPGADQAGDDRMVGPGHQ